MTLEEVTARLSAILSGIRRTRSSLYPADWKFDPLIRIEQELEALLDDIKR